MQKLGLSWRFLSGKWLKKSLVNQISTKVKRESDSLTVPRFSSIYGKNSIAHGGPVL